MKSFTAGFHHFLFGSFLDSTMHGMKDDVTKIKESQMMMIIREELEGEMCRRRYI